MIALFILCLVFLAYHTWYVWSIRQERKEWMKALMAKNLQDFTDAHVVESSARGVKQKPQEEFTEVDQLDDQPFQHMIDMQIKKDV